jgi:UDP-N-acetylglucosamine 2-epimerase (non-hydrolysing)
VALTVKRARVLTVVGTRPEAIKLAPVLREINRHGDRLESRVCATAQHREMLDQVLGLFGIEPDLDLDLMQPDQSLAGFAALALGRLAAVLETEAPDLVLVQGDTTTTLAAALAAHYAKVPVGHVEAGLRTRDPYSPFPEEMNRRLTSRLATLHFAPTALARDALLAEGVPPASIVLSGNTVIDALLDVTSRPRPGVVDALLAEAAGPGGRRSRVMLVTAHRRESFGEGLRGICDALLALVAGHADVAVVYPVHPNPSVSGPVRAALSATEGVVLTGPLDYDVMAHLLASAHLVLTDSGGLQEEAPALGKPVLVLRSETERPEGVAAGVATVVGTDPRRIVAEAERLLGDVAAYERMARAVHPYGDGKAATRIVEALLASCNSPG